MLVEEQKDNKEMVITYLHAGEFFGEMGLFEDGVRSAWIKAKTDCEICEISYSKFRELSDTNPEFMRRPHETNHKPPQGDHKKG